jgi:hypothetical protein
MKIQLFLIGNTFTSPLQRSTGYCCLGEKSLFLVINVLNTKTRYMGRIQSSIVSKVMARITTSGFKSVILGTLSERLTGMTKEN